MDHWYCANIAEPGGHNINAIDIVIPCPNQKLSQNWTIDIMTSWVIDIVTPCSNPKLSQKSGHWYYDPMNYRYCDLRQRSQDQYRYNGLPGHDIMHLLILWNSPIASNTLPAFMKGKNHSHVWSVLYFLLKNVISLNTLLGFTKNIKSMTKLMTVKWTNAVAVMKLSLIHIWRCRRSTLCRSRWSPYH